ncbi:hypothetical protein AAOE16_10230 [Ekhidna sp. MALMAid0563]|uniref:hypothetical protein n=1 Tax=Ekhidna sp. MALMAid0563 TaxID=3143937 RepID=UPI0032DE83F3
MNKFLIPFSFTLILFVSHLHAQTNSDTAVDNDVNAINFKMNYNKNAFYRKGLKYYRDNKKVSYKEFIESLVSYEESKIEINHYKKHKKTSSILSGIGIVAVALSWSIADEDASMGIGYTGISLLSVGSFFSNKSQKHLNMAIWHHNREAAINPN